MVISTEWGIVTARHSGKILSIAGEATVPGAPAQQWHILRDQLSQRFRFEPLDDGHYLIRVRRSRLVLDVAGGSLDNGAVVCQWEWHGGNNQRFGLVDAGDGYYALRAKHSGKVLEVADRSTDDGAQIRQWDWHGGANQRWCHGVLLG